jgi:hypothetical protein
MNLIEIRGDRDLVGALGDIVGLTLNRRTATQLEGNQVSISGYASNEALNAVRALGATVTVITSSAEWEQQMAEIYQMRGYHPGYLVPYLTSTSIEAALGALAAANPQSVRALRCPTQRTGQSVSYVKIGTASGAVSTWGGRHWRVHAREWALPDAF